MSTHSRPKTRRQLRHPSSRSKSHQLDKQQGDERKETSWVGVDAPQRPSPERSFPGLEGHEYIFDGQAWRRCKDPEEFADYCERENKRRGWFLDQTTRKGVAVEMLRRVKGALEILTVTFSPWLNDYIAEQLAQQKDPRPQLATVRTQWLEEVQKVLSGERHVLGYAFHADTDDLHFDLALTRQDGEGGRIGGNGLGLVGPWCCGVDRQLRSGAEISAEKRSQMRRAIANYRRRHGEESKPLDVQLARALDAAADEIIGPELRPYREAYAKKVPELERAHRAAQLTILEDAHAKILSCSNPEQETDGPSVS
jgi:dipeptidyl aminopeptidase/acylaminoacyl peptidase